MPSNRKYRGNKRRVVAYLGMGSNTGDRVGYIQQAVQLLKDVPDVEVLECSSLYETEPIGKEYRSWFVNAVLVVRTGLISEDLLAEMKNIENRLVSMHSICEADTEPEERARIIDLDILLFGDEILATQELTIPHPRLHKRAFALVPMLELAPDMMHPTCKKSITQIHAELPNPERVVLYGTRQRREPDC